MTATAASAAAAGALYSFLLRILSFTLSQLTIRFVDPSTLGKAAIRLELICSTTVLFLGREGFRLSLMRVADLTGNGNTNAHPTKNDSSKVDEDEEQLRAKRVNNVAWLSVPISLSLTFAALMFHLHTCRDHVNVTMSGNSSFDNGENELSDYKLAGILYCLATSIEIISEPCMIACLRTMDVKTRAKAEAFASIGKALSLVFLLSSVRREFHAASFGFSQCIYATILSAALYLNKWKSLQLPSSLSSLMRGNSHNSSLWEKMKYSLDMSTLRLSFMFSLQSVFKHVLTEGDRIVLTALVGAYDSGVYAMASSYGGMASRLLFQPLEENGRLLFSNKHAVIVQAREKAEAAEGTNQGRGHEENQRKKEVSKLVDELELTYCVLVKFVLYIGLLFAAFGSNYTSILLRLLAGERWGSNLEASKALSAFCIYTALMALNGMTEAFVYGVAQSGLEVGSLAVAHGIVGMVFYVVGPLLVVRGEDMGLGVGSGTIGLVMANGLCMALRSIYSLHFANTYFNKYRYLAEAALKETAAKSNYTKLGFGFVFELFGLLEKVMPRLPILALSVCAYKLMDASSKSLEKGGNLALLSIETVTHIGLGVSFLVIICGAMFVLEKDFGRSLKAMVASKRAKDSTDKSKIE